MRPSPSQQPPPGPSSSTEPTADASFLQRLIARLTAGGDPRELLLDDAAGRLLPVVRLPRRFDAEMRDRLLLPAAGLELSSAFDTLRLAGLVTPVAGRPGWFQPEGPGRASPQAAEAGATDEWVAGGERWLELHRRLGDWFERSGADGELESLYHRLSSGDASGEARWTRLYEQARDSFDLARCETLLKLLDDCARFVDPALVTHGSRERGLLGARATLADDHLRTSRYLERDALLMAFEALLEDPRHFILQFHAPGGSGKTMFLRWLGPRWCLPRGVPIARIDFDFLDAGERRLANAFMLGKLAERLDAQLVGAPMFELLRDLAEDRERLQQQPAEGRGAALVELEREVCERMARVLVEHCPGLPVLLVFDTLEDAAVKHDVNVESLIDAIAHLRREMLLLRPSGGPRLMLLLAGRYSLAEQYPAVDAKFAAERVAFAVPPFDGGESRAYLGLRLKGTSAAPSTVLVDAVVERAKGNPFKLSLYADILITTPDITIDELGKDVDVDMLYLIERVLVRLKDDALHWLLRYGVLARQLTREFVEAVLLAPVRRSMRGGREHDDPSHDGVAHRKWPHLWVAGVGAPLQRADVADLWNRLRGYASASSWIAVDARNADAVVIQPVASVPMRRALLREERSVVAEVHRAAIAHAKRSPDDANALADLTYHEFQLHGPAAAKTWWTRIRRRMKEHGRDDGVLAMASVVVSDDLVESDLRRAGSALPLVDEATRAGALHIVAQVHAGRAAGETDHGLQSQEQSLARSYLSQYDDLIARGTKPPIGGIDDGLLRLQVFGADAAQRAAALQSLEAALATRLDSATRGLALRLLQRFSVDDPVASRRWSQRWGHWAVRAGDAAAYSQHVMEESRARMRDGQPAAALALLIDGRDLLQAGGVWSDREAARTGAVAVAEEEPGALVAAGLYEAARRRDAQLHRTGLPAPDAATEMRRARHHAALMLASGDIVGAMRATAQLLATPNPAERPEKWRIDALLLQAQAASEAIDFGLALDALSEATALQSQLGDHVAEVSTGLHKARIQLFDVGNLQLAAEQMQDSDGAFASEGVELRIEHTLLRASLAALTGRPGYAAGLLVAAETLVAESPGVASLTGLLLALTGLLIGPAGERARYATLLADRWESLDFVGARLIPSVDFARAEPIGPLPPALVRRLERLSRVEPLALAGQRRLCSADRIRLALRRVDLLRVIGSAQRAADELLGLRAVSASHPPGPWMRDVALSCDRLGLDPGQVLPSGWLARFVATLRRLPMLRGATYLEEAERGEGKGDETVALSLLGRSIKAWSTVGAPIGVWQLRQLELQSRLQPADPASPGTAGGPSVAVRIEALRRQLGRPAPAAAADQPKPRIDMEPLEIVPSLVTGLRIDEADRMVRVAHLENGRSEERRTEPLGPSIVPMLEAMAAGRINDVVAPMLVPMLYGRGVVFGRFLADGVLGEMLLGRLQAATQGHLRPQELAIEHQRSGMHAMPWELMVPLAQNDAGPNRPITLHPAVSSFWRAPSGFTLQARVGWVQRRLGGLLVDGRCGPKTVEAVRAFQVARSLVPTGRIDPATLELMRSTVPPSHEGVARVLLITPSREVNIASQRGKDSYGTDLEWTYRAHGLEVISLREPDPSRLRQLLAQPFGVIHIAAPIAQARSSRELSLQFAATHESSHTTAFGPRLLARSLQGSPLVVVETPRSSSREETIRQLLLRNAFAAQLFEQGELPSVIALGLAPPEVEQSQSDLLVEGLAERRPAAEIVKELRRTRLPERSAEDLVEQLCTAGIALFSRDPEVVALPSEPA